MAGAGAVGVGGVVGVNCQEFSVRGTLAAAQEEAAALTDTLACS